MQIGSPVARCRGRSAIPDRRRRSPRWIPGLDQRDGGTMQLTLFKAFQSLKLDDDTATKVVEALEEHIAVKIKEANAGLEAKLNAVLWLLGTMTLMLAIIGTTPVYLKLFG
jgi:hypothetical protein